LIEAELKKIYKYSSRVFKEILSVFSLM